MKIKCITYKCAVLILNFIHLYVIHLIFMTRINVECSPNLELYTCVCNTLNLHDTEVESSLKIMCITYKCIKFKIRTAFNFSVMKIMYITYKFIKFMIRTAFYIDQCHLILNFIHLYVIHLIFMTLINVERSPNHQFYKFVCNTLNLHDTDQCRTQS
jgi:hypothetical protein